MTITHDPTHATGQRFGRLAGELAGATDARPPLVFLHGLTYDRRNWGPALAELRDVDPHRRTLALDLPGHGESSDVREYDILPALELLHAAIIAAGIESPVVVGHSAGAMAATFYAANFAARGVVNVDQPLLVRQFAEQIRSSRGRLHGDGWRDIWAEQLEQMHLERLPAEAQRLLATTSTPRQDLLVGYWKPVLELDPAELAALTDSQLAAIRSKGIPYTTVMGETPDLAYTDWLAARVPQATMTAWAGSGHFPHLAHPLRFARLLAGTANWPDPRVRG